MPRGRKAQKNKAEEEAHGTTKKQRLVVPTVQEIITDDLTKLSLEYWAPIKEREQEVLSKPFQASLVQHIYDTELKSGKLERVMLLELSHYLEKYLLPHFDAPKSSFAHLMSILLMVNEKFRENVPAWDAFHLREEVFPGFFERVLNLRTEKLTLPERTNYILFLINCFQSLEDSMVRKECLKLVSLPLWNALNPSKLQQILKSRPKIAKHWNYLKQKEKDSSKKKNVDHEKEFIPSLINDYFEILDKAVITQPSTESGEPTKVVSVPELKFCERFIEFMLDLVSQLPTRRYFRTYLRDVHLIERSQLSELVNHPQGILFKQLLHMLVFFEGFELDDFTGQVLSEDEVTAKQCEKIHQLQKIAFVHFQPELKQLALSNISALETREGVLKHIAPLSDKQLRSLCEHLALIGPNEQSVSRQLLEEILCSSLERRVSQKEAVLEQPIYPIEDLMWNNDVIPSEEYNGEHPLALPKLNLQFLSFYDYLLRNFDLFRLESAYAIRGDIEDAIKRMNPCIDPNPIPKSAPVTPLTGVTFTGWSRMALPITEFQIVQLGKPRIGENRPSKVIAEINYSIQRLAHGTNVRNEWDSLKLHDVLFLIAIRPTVKPGEERDTTKPFPEQYGIKYVRGCEVLELYDEEGTIIKDIENEPSPRKGNLRKLRVSMDCSQYQLDVEQKEEDVYGAFNVLVRRKPKENNFKAVLETIRDLMNTKTAIPEWLHDIFLGYGDLEELSKKETKQTLDYVDTFLNAEHIVNSFPSRKVVLKTIEGKTVTKDASLAPPFKITFPGSDSDEPVVAEAYLPPLRGPYPQDIPKKNQIPFTPKQVEAITSGMVNGLTMVVGPPGTGKTDVAVQIISNWYHNYPGQRTLLVTHSNQALNQLFDKLVELDIDERHLLRLGHGEEYLESTKDFSKYGRVNYMLAKRLDLLKEVERLGKTLGMTEDVAYTCETAEYFFNSHVKPLWQSFEEKAKEFKGEDSVATNFPFTKFFANAPQPLFKQSLQEDMRTATGCWRHINNLFVELGECRPFELLRTPIDRANYLVTKQAKVVAMTCTHAAIKREELVNLGFKYDNLLMEEAAQILEIETFIPMLLQGHDQREGVRLKRVVLIGDHHQLPPIIKNMAFQKYSHMDQSLFARFVRLGVPTIDLDAQGRARPSIAQLYNWRYKSLKDLPVVHSTEYQMANTGLRFDYQLIDVQDFGGQGETQPAPFFYQNLGEAEYAVALYMYMRLLGYPANKISILTTYNGQKQKIKEVLKARCVHPFYGYPAKVSTVDRYQGQQNDYIILSLVRTKAVGHLRDSRRLVVAMSRARLGLYILCRKQLFANCYELTPSFSKLITRPDKLQLVENENYPTQRKLNDEVPSFQVEDAVHLGNLIANMHEKMSVAYEAQQRELQRQQEEQQRLAQQQAEEEHKQRVEMLRQFEAERQARKDVEMKDRQQVEEEEDDES